jgi:hypothetical protein
MASAERARAARDLAYWHFVAEPEISKILWVRPGGGDDEPLRFVEVLPHRSGVEHGIEVFGFDATGDVPYSSEVALVTEKELKLVAADVLSLPEGWSLEEVQTFTREELGVAQAGAPAA